MGKYLLCVLLFVFLWRHNEKVQFVADDVAPQMVYGHNGVGN